MEKQKYTPPTISLRQLESCRIIAESYTPSKEIKAKFTLELENMQLLEGTDNGEDLSNYNSFKYDWEEVH